MNFTEATNVLVTTTQLVFTYNRNTLLIAYFASIIVAAGLSVLGLIRAWTNGYVGDFKFSTLVRTTRDPAIAALIRGTELGASPLPKRIAKTKLFFGTSETFEVSDGLTRRATFGIRGRVAELHRGAEI